MNPVQYIIVGREVGRKMSKGKFGAQVAHASQMGLRLNATAEHDNPYDASIVNNWMLGGHYAKIVLVADGLDVAQRYTSSRGFGSYLVIDEGRTEFGGLTPTSLGFPVLDKDNPHVRETFKAFELYSDDYEQACLREQLRREREQLREQFERPQRSAPDMHHWGRPLRRFFTRP